MKTQDITNVRAHLQNSSDLFEAMGAAIDAGITVEICKVAQVINAGLKSAHSLFCATEQYEEDLKPFNADEFVTSITENETNVAHLLSEFIKSSLEDPAGNYCKALSVVIEVLDSLEASDICTA